MHRSLALEKVLTESLALQTQRTGDKFLGVVSTFLITGTMSVFEST